jgi:hypothetical protein
VTGKVTYTDTQVCIKGAMSKKEFLSAISSKLKPYYIFNSDEKTLKKFFFPTITLIPNIILVPPLYQTHMKT